ncbi:unnamed protein product [Cuscuta campestris]|uniref:Peptidase A2 domain-containing protein n=1 Tax=Cuscuta campestris TaxID=132261 RepID=A0A484MIQ8_9ASTE|nr:unnamed protein product [Cuscuta campestris]
MQNKKNRRGGDENVPASATHTGGLLLFASLKHALVKVDKLLTCTLCTHTHTKKHDGKTYVNKKAAKVSGENTATGGRHPPINVTEAEVLIQRVGITAEQFKEVLAALTPNREVVVEDATGEPAGGKAGPAGSGGKKKKKVRRSKKKKVTKPNRKARVEDELSILDKEDESSSFERASAFDRLGDPTSKKPRTSAFDRLQDTRSVRKGGLREKLKERRGESSATSKIGSEERQKVVEDKEATELRRMYERLEKQLDVRPRITSLASGRTWWEKEARDVQGADDQALLQAALPQGDVRKELRRNPLSTYQEMLARAKYLALEEEEAEPPVQKEKKSGQPVTEGRKRKDFGGDSTSSRKKWKNMVHLAEVQRPPLPKRKKKEPLIFTDEDYPPVLSPHRDALVIKVEINNVVVHRTLVDTDSSVNIMYSNTFRELGLSRSDLKPIRTPLSGFTGDTIEAEGTITVKAWVGDGTHRLWLDMEFMIVQLDCAHHLIIGRPEFVPVMLWATKSQARVDENVSTICAAMQKEEGRPREEPVEEVEELALDPSKLEQKVKVGKTLPPRLKEQLMGVLRSFKVLFAWGPEDMPGVDPQIICHRLAVDPAHKPIKQKKRFLSS